MEIPLTRGMVAVIDDEDYALVKPYRWKAHRSNSGWYAAARVQIPCTIPGQYKAIRVWMHRLIAQPPSTMLVDHRNHDTLDNRRANLRAVTRSQNQQNRRGATVRSATGVRGVYLDKRWGRFVAQTTIDGKIRQVGRFSSLDEAATAVRAFRAAHMTHSEEAR
jgi:hypothetical protein